MSSKVSADDPRVFRSRCSWNLWWANWIKRSSRLQRRAPREDVESSAAERKEKISENIIADPTEDASENRKRKVHRIEIDNFAVRSHLTVVAQLAYVNPNILIFIAIALSEREFNMFFAASASTRHRFFPLSRLLAVIMVLMLLARAKYLPTIGEIGQLSEWAGMICGFFFPSLVHLVR